jgi:hypothetical protein
VAGNDCKSAISDESRDKFSSSFSRILLSYSVVVSGTPPVGQPQNREGFVS